MSRPVAELHADWLRLVEPEGQFLSLPVLRRAFLTGLGAVPPSIRVVLSKHYPHPQRGATPGDEQWNSWLEWLLRDVLAWGPAYRSGDDAAIFTHAVPERDIVLRADAALVDPETEKPRVIVVRYAHGTPLDRRLTGERWNASPLDRLALLCRAHAVRIGLLTDGERILLAWIPAQGPGGHATWETGLFTESRERNLLQSFISLLHASRFFGVHEGDQLESLFEESTRAESDVTDRLGFQVRQAVELLIAAISRGDLESNGALLAGIAPQRVYEAAATVMMRLVFLLFAEERDLLPLDDPFYAESYAASTLREQLNEQAIVEGDEPLERRSAAWFRLLALFRAVYAGLEHDRLRIPPYGGRLFDPDRFPFLEGRTADKGWSQTASWPLAIDDLTVRAILEALQTLPIREGASRERRRLSFRALDVEQIGHVYEGLLDHGAVRVDDVYVGLIGKDGDEAELALAELEARAEVGPQPLVSFLHDHTGRSEAALAQMIERGRAIAMGANPEARRLVNTACDNDGALAVRIAPYYYTLRKDLHELPLVFAAHSLVVKKTRERRNSGTEYTPRHLAEEIVRFALEPLVYSPGPKDGVPIESWRLRPAQDLLGLRICDPAVGSGAFLVSACRYLADCVVEAWLAEDPSRATIDREELTLDARRTVVENCLYGVDRDPMAVEMAKLSLWLVTMARERPFSFLDHAIREGDSLIGITSLDQLRYLHTDPKRGEIVHARTLTDSLALTQSLADRAAEMRRDLKAIPNRSVRDSQEKQRLSEQADLVLEKSRVVADAVAATAFATASDSSRKRDAAFQGLGSLVARVLDDSASAAAQRDALDRLRAHGEYLLNKARPERAPIRSTLHWPLAFPEIFEAGGFHAVVSNPPFVRDASLQQTIGRDFRNYLVADIASGKRGRSDLCGYFLLRITMICRSIAIVATNSIAEGDTREVALDTLVANGWQIVGAVRSIPWPGIASVHISKLWLARNNTHTICMLDGDVVTSISSSLRPIAGELIVPKILRASSGLMFNGSKVNGSGFVLESSEAEAIIAAGSRYRSVVKPYMSGEDACTSPELLPSRWIIDFSGIDLDHAADEFSICFKIVEERVKPERTRVNARGDYVLRRPLPQRWWQFGDARRALYENIAEKQWVVVIPATSKYAVPVRVPTGPVFSHSLNVAVSDSFALQAVLGSRTHYAWMRYRPSTLETRNRYNPSDTLQTFPLPGETPSLTDLAMRCDDVRSQVMRENSEGITLTYNRIHDRNIGDQAIVRLRRLTEELEYAVLRAYSWDDIDLAYGFHETDQGVQWIISPIASKLIVERLLELNQRRHQEEERNTSRGAARTKRRRSPQQGAIIEQLSIDDQSNREVTVEV